MGSTQKIKQGIGTFLTEDDVAELAAHILGVSPYEDVVGEIEEKLVDRWGLNLTQFADIVGRLLPMAGNFTSGLTGTPYRAFAIVETNGSAMSLVKMEVDPKNQKNYK